VATQDWFDLSLREYIRVGFLLVFPVLCYYLENIAWALSFYSYWISLGCSKSTPR
jgi:hypothetical protein